MKKQKNLRIEMDYLNACKTLHPGFTDGQVIDHVMKYYLEHHTNRLPPEVIDLVETIIDSRLAQIEASVLKGQQNIIAQVNEVVIRLEDLTNVEEFEIE